MFRDATLPSSDSRAAIIVQSPFADPPFSIGSTRVAFLPRRQSPVCSSRIARKLARVMQLTSPGSIARATQVSFDDLHDGQDAGLRVVGERAPRLNDPFEIRVRGTSIGHIDKNSTAKMQRAASRVLLTSCRHR